MLGNNLVLDSCFGNALSHFVHNLLFWVGNRSLISWGTTTEVRARLYRAHAIEGADTFFVEAVANGIQLRLVASHACREKAVNTETVVCEHATIRYEAGTIGEIIWNDGRRELVGVTPFDTPLMNHLDYYRYLRGETDRPAITLEDCRSFVHLNGLTYISSQTIENIAPGHLVVVEDNGKGFQPDDAKLPSTAKRRFGLFGMRERLALVHGELDVESAPECGTTLFIRIPLERITPGPGQGVS